MPRHDSALVVATSGLVRPKGLVMVQPTQIVSFEALAVGDSAIAGGKGANLGELCRAGFPVPPGFVISAAAYLRARWTRAASAPIS